MRFRRRREPDRIPFSEVASVRGGTVWADVQPVEIGVDFVLFPGNARVQFDGHGNPSARVGGTVRFHLRAVGPNTQIEIGARRG